MADKAAPVTDPKARPTGLGLGIPTQSRRGGQPELRRVTLTPTSSSMPVSDVPAARPTRATGSPPRDSGGVPRRDDWVRRARSLIVGSDTVVVILAVLIASFITVDAEFSFGFSWAMEGSVWLLGGMVVMWWLVSLTVEGVWDASALTNTTVEVRRILVASLMVFAGVGIFGYLTGSDLARPYLLVVAPAGIAGLVANHWFWHRRFMAFRRTLDHRPADVVPRDIPDLSAPAPTAISSSAVAPRAVSDPRLSRRRMAAKTVLDVTVAVAGLLLLSPALVAAAVLIVLTDGGPVLQQQEYVGRNGRVFKSWTFRCTPYGAKARPTATLSSTGDDRGAEYGLATTSIGHFLRRTGLAEAPLLFNVLARQMSVVGPRPLTPENFAPASVAVRPGITGQWRVATRPANDAGPGLDGVENWSMMRDVKVIARTLRLAVNGRL